MLQLGIALGGREDFENARVTLKSAADRYVANGSGHLQVETDSALASIALYEGDKGEAQRRAGRVIAHLDGGGSLDGTEDPLRIRWCCFEVLRAVGDPRADQWLADTWALIDARANQIRDPGRRAAFRTPQMETTGMKHSVHYSIAASIFLSMTALPASADNGTDGLMRSGGPVVIPTTEINLDSTTSISGSGGPPTDNISHSITALSGGSGGPNGPRPSSTLAIGGTGTPPGTNASSGIVNSISGSGLPAGVSVNSNTIRSISGSGTAGGVSVDAHTIRSISGSGGPGDRRPSDIRVKPGNSVAGKLLGGAHGTTEITGSGATGTEKSGGPVVIPGIDGIDNPLVTPAADSAIK